MSNRSQDPAEEQRLATLRSLGILDSAPDEHFDRITAHARRLVQVSPGTDHLRDLPRDRLLRAHHRGTGHHGRPGRSPGLALRREPARHR
jgi:hypothetical protein